MAVFTSDKPTKTIGEEEKVNRDDPNLKTSTNTLASSFYSIDWYLGSESISWSGGYESEFGRFDDEGMEMVQVEEEEGANLISDWVISDVSRPISDEEFPVTVASIPVGVVLSVKDKQVIVEGKAKHNLLSIGCFLWITETRVPLGYVDEVFGSVKKPCCSVSLKSDSQVPEGISQGTQVSIIVENFDMNVCAAASSGEEIELSGSDDECKKTQKKITSDQETGNPSDSRNCPGGLLPQMDRFSENAATRGPETNQQKPYQPSDSHPAVARTGGLLPEMDRFAVNPATRCPGSNQPKPYQPPMAKQISMGMLPNQAPAWKRQMPNPVTYPPQQFRNRQSYVNKPQPFGFQKDMHKPYPNAAANPFPYRYPRGQPLQESQRLIAGPSSDRGGKVYYRGGGSGFRLGRGRDLPQHR